MELIWLQLARRNNKFRARTIEPSGPWTKQEIMGQEHIHKCPVLEAHRSVYLPCSSTVTDTRLQALLPNRSVSEEFFKYFLMVQLPCSQHWNCWFFLRNPAICIQPSSPTTSSTTTPSSLYFPSSKFVLPKPSLTIRTITRVTQRFKAVDIEHPSFIAFVSFSVMLPFLCWYLTFLDSGSRLKTHADTFKPVRLQYLN